MVGCHARWSCCSASFGRPEIQKESSAIQHEWVVGTGIRNLLRNGTPRDWWTSILIPKLVQSLQSAGSQLCPFQSLASRRSFAQIGPTSEPWLHDDSHRLSAVGASVEWCWLTLAQRPACFDGPDEPNLRGQKLGTVPLTASEGLSLRVTVGTRSSLAAT